MVEQRPGEVITHFLAMEPVAVAALVDVEAGPGAATKKKALAFIVEDKTLDWVRSQSKEKGFAPDREHVLQAREMMRWGIEPVANPIVSERLKLRPKAAGYKWASRWRRAWSVCTGAFTRGMSSPLRWCRRRLGPSTASPIHRFLQQHSTRKQ